MQISYITNGVKMGHYHYAQNLLAGLSKVDDASVDTFFIREDDDAKFPGAHSIRPLATSTKNSFAANLLFTLSYHVQFAVYLIMSRPDVIHFNTVFRNQYHTYVLTLLGKIAGARIVRTVHEVTAERLRDVSDWEQRIAYRHLQSCNHLIVHSEDVQEDLRSNGVSTPTTVLPHGNYLFFRDHLDPEAKPPLPIDDEPVVLFFGPKRHKGIDIFAEALTEVETSFTTWIAGPVNPDAKETVNRLKSDPNVYVDTGYIPDKELPAYFDHADIVVLPYLSGTTSGAVHLARAFENAVITSPLPCFTDVVEHREDGYIIGESTPSDLAKALEELILSPELAQDLAESGLATEQSERFNWDRIAEETIQTYRSTE